MTYSLVKIIGFANANVCCNNKLLGYSSSLQSSIIKSSLGGSCVLPMDPEHKLKKKLKKKLKNSSKKLKKSAFFGPLFAGNAFKKEAWFIVYLFGKNCSVSQENLSVTILDKSGFF